MLKFYSTKPFVEIDMTVIKPKKHLIN